MSNFRKKYDCPQKRKIYRERQKLKKLDQELEDQLQQVPDGKTLVWTVDKKGLIEYLNKEFSKDIQQCFQEAKSNSQCIP